MVHRRLGRTGLMVSPIGFGAFKIGRNQGAKYGQPYALPDERESARLLNSVLDLGINYFDTAPAYGLSEDRIGAALAGRSREFVLSTKVGETFTDGASTYDFSSTAVRSSLERSLERLRTDCVDVVLVHSSGDDLRILRQTDIVATLLRARQDGLARFIGFSGKTPQGAAAAMDWADVLMIEHHCDDQSHAPIIERAAQRELGIVVKKGLGSGRLPAAQAIPFVLNNPAIASMVIGSLSIEHLRENLRIAAACDEAVRSRES